MNRQFDFFPRAFQSISLSGLDRHQGFAVPGEVFSELAAAAFERLSFTLGEEHLKGLIGIALSGESSENDRYVAANLLKNAQAASNGVFALCQDTGIATVFGWKDGAVLCGGEQEFISQGIGRVYREKNLRFSTVCPASFFDEYDPRDNLPAQIMLFQNGEEERRTAARQFAATPYYRFLFCAKGGGSSNKTAFIQGTKALLNEKAFENLLEAQIQKIGTAACPPYTIAVVAGGLSPEQNLLALKLATCGFYDKTGESGGANGNAPEIPFRDSYWEDRVLDIAKKTGFGAQFGGTAFALKAVVLRLCRHGASCPVSVGVSCSAHRNLEAYITKDGFYLEKTCENPARLDGFAQAVKIAENKTEKTGGIERIDTRQGIARSLAVLSQAEPGTKFLLSGPVIVARDQAHAKWKQLIDEGKELPGYCGQYPVFYAGPAETPPGKPCGSFGPTTAGRMDSYAGLLMSRGASLITLAKGNRSEEWTAACKKYGAVYLGTIGGAAALIADENVVSSQIIDYPELGMEAVRLVEIRDLPIFVLTSAAGKDFYELIARNKKL